MAGTQSNLQLFTRPTVTEDQLLSVNQQLDGWAAACSGLIAERTPKAPPDPDAELIENLGIVRDLLARIADAGSRRDHMPANSDIDAVHMVRETFTGSLVGASDRRLRYAGNGRWEAAPGCFVLWRDLGGSVHDWKDDRDSLASRASHLINKTIDAHHKAKGAK